MIFLSILSILQQMMSPTTKDIHMRNAIIAREKAAYKKMREADAKAISMHPILDDLEAVVESETDPKRKALAQNRLDKVYDIYQHYLLYANDIAVDIVKAQFELKAFNAK